MFLQLPLKSIFFSADTSVCLKRQKQFVIHLIFKQAEVCLFFFFFSFPPKTVGMHIKWHQTSTTTVKDISEIKNKQILQMWAGRRWSSNEFISEKEEQQGGMEAV